MNESLPFSRFLDLDKNLRTQGLVGEPTYPTEDMVRTTMQYFGVGINDTIICYNQRGKFGNGRVYHILTTYGFQHVKVLNGDIEYWKEHGMS